jgi:hypothetical protein
MNNAFNMLLNGAATSVITRQLMIMLDLSSEYYWMHLVGKAFFNLPRRKVLCNGKGVFVQLLKRKHSANVPLILPTAHQ